jgi:hypothetical protein
MKRFLFLLLGILVSFLVYTISFLIVIHYQESEYLIYFPLSVCILLSLYSMYYIFTCKEI